MSIFLRRRLSLSCSVFDQHPRGSDHSTSCASARATAAAASCPRPAARSPSAASRPCPSSSRLAPRSATTRLSCSGIVRAFLCGLTSIHQRTSATRRSCRWAASRTRRRCTSRARPRSHPGAATSWSCRAGGMASQARFTLSMATPIKRASGTRSSSTRCSLAHRRVDLNRRGGQPRVGHVQSDAKGRARSPS